jgi:AraC-like DNA-binding protein
MDNGWPSASVLEPICRNYQRPVYWITKAWISLCAPSGVSGWGGAAWEIPSFENAEVMVSRLARSGVIAYDRAVGAALLGDPQALTRRSVQRHFLHVAGMTQSRFRQIERARHAVHLLRSGSSILDVVHEVGYFDQAHLTRSLKHLIGQTPLKLQREESQLSFLYKTEASTYR